MNSPSNPTKRVRRSERSRIPIFSKSISEVLGHNPSSYHSSIAAVDQFDMLEVSHVQNQCAIWPRPIELIMTAGTYGNGYGCLVGICDSRS